MQATGAAGRVGWNPPRGELSAIARIAIQHRVEGPTNRGLTGFLPTLAFCVRGLRMQTNISNRRADAKTKNSQERQHRLPHARNGNSPASDDRCKRAKC